MLQKEIKTAFDVVEERLDTDIFLIPVWIQVGSPLPKDEMPDRLSRVQWINLPEADGWQKLIRSMEYKSRQLRRDTDGMPATAAQATSLEVAVAGASAEQLIKNARTAVQGANPAEVQESVAAVVEVLKRRSHGLTAQHGARLLARLWRKQLLGLARELGDALIRAGLDTCPIRRLYAEALLEQHWLAAALDELALLEKVAADPTERALVADLRGRSHTAAYLSVAHDAGDASTDELWKAVDAYNAIYTSDPSRYLLHGARAAALALHEARRRGNAAARKISPTDIAAQVLDDVRDHEDSAHPLGVDECEAALYAALALDRHEEALDWMRRCLAHPELDLVNLRTLECQLSEVWQLRQDDPYGQALLTPLVAQLASMSAPWQLTAEPKSVPTSRALGGEPPPALEKVFLPPPYKTLVWVEKGIACARQVARIEAEHSVVATGFLVCGRELHDSLPDEPVLLTSAYVVTNDPAVKDQYAFSVMGPEDVQARFEDDAQTYSLDVLWTSFTAGTTILRLTPRLQGDRRLAITERFPLVDGEERALIIGYPGGRDLSFSIDDNVILDADERVVHYRTPTEPGSAGSPVFDSRFWKVIAIHYAGGLDRPRLHGRPGAYAANEGIRIDFIRAQITATVT